MRAWLWFALAVQPIARNNLAEIGIVIRGPGDIIATLQRREIIRFTDSYSHLSAVAPIRVAPNFSQHPVFLRCQTALPHS